MTNTKSTKRALMTSIVALFLCFSMLLGTTYAWFTDSVTSTNNIIQSGNLDVELEYYDAASKTWKKVDKNTNVFQNTLWEPGHAEIVYLKVSNLGTLALKYQLGVNISSEKAGINAAGEVFYLSDYIMFGVENDLTPDTAITRAEAIAKVSDTATKLNVAYSKSSQLYPANSQMTSAEYVAMVVYMPTTVGNEANGKTGVNAPQINLGINLFATQFTYEGDSFGTDYDKDAAWTGDTDTSWYNTTDKEFTLITAEQLAGLAELVNGKTDTFAGKTVKLGANIDLNNAAWTPIGTASAEGEKAYTRTFAGTFIGTGYTISNLRVVGGSGIGLFGRVGTGAHIEGVTIENAYVSGTDYVGAVAGYAYLAANCLKNCTVTNATVIATPFQLANGEYDGGAKAGAIVGYALNGNITGNTVKNSTVMAYRDLGGIAGMFNADGIGDRTIEAAGNTVEGVTLSYVGVAGKYAEGKVNENMSAVVGRVANKANVIVDEAKNEVKDVKLDKENAGATMIFTLAELLAFVQDVNAGNTYAGKTVILGADIDLANMEWTPIGATGSFNGIFDGNGHTISNLKITGKKSTVGLFGNTYNGEIRNLTVKNATVSGRLNVGVVAGNPYTSKYTNVTVTGHVEVNGMAYVGGVGGKNAYANWTNVKVDVDDTSYVKAISTEDGKAYRTYVGGVVGFNGEGGHTFKNITSNIDVIGDVCDIGGVFGIAHYGNNFENIICTGNVTNLVSAENDGDDAAIDVLETGLIAGVWHNENGTTVTFKNISATGTISTPNVTPAEKFPNNGLIGKKYSATGTGVLTIINYVDEGGITYANDLVNGKKTLYLVPSDYEGDTVNVPEGVDAIGNYAFAYNSNVETVVLSSSVRDLGRGFDGSTVKKVVLNEGLEVISSRAFRSTTALEEVVISSTVTEIADNAFQKSGIKEIVIPATVKTVGETAFGASLIEKVTFEGDTAIQGYAFRGCPNLRTVVLNGYNVTFVPSTLNGRDSMWFCNGESNNPNTSDIDFYVKNDVIKERVLTAMGAERNNTDVYTEEQEVAGGSGIFEDANGDTYAYASDKTTFEQAAANNVDTIYLSSGNYVIPTAAQGKTLTIVGSGKDTSVAVTKVGVGGENCDYGLDGSNVVFENLTITTNSSTYIGYARCNGTYNNCTINGTYTLYGNSVFNNCTFNVSGDVYNIWTWGADEASFTECTFNCDGKAILLYGSANTKLTVTGCTFNDNGDDTVTDKAAIEIGNDYGKSYEVIIDDTTVNGFAIAKDSGASQGGTNSNSNVWGNKNRMPKEKLNVVIDGVDVY